MPGRKISAIKIKDLRYAEVLTVAPTIDDVAGNFKGATKIENSHQGTFTYEEAEPTVNNYKNQLNGQTYRSDVDPGDKKINFVIGQYDFVTKAALQGGEASQDGKSWVSGDRTKQRYKCFFALTEDDVLIVFPKANIVGRNNSQDNAVGLAVSAIPQEVSGLLSDEYWFDAAELSLEAPPVG